MYVISFSNYILFVTLSRLYGSYGAIKGNLVNWALQDLTGGITDNFVFKDNPQMLKQIVDVCMARTSLISTSIQVIYFCHYFMTMSGITRPCNSSRV